MSAKALEFCAANSRRRSSLKWIRLSCRSLSPFNSRPRCCSAPISCSSSDSRPRNCAISSSHRSTSAEFVSISFAQLFGHRSAARGFRFEARRIGDAPVAYPGAATPAKSVCIGALCPPDVAANRSGASLREPGPRRATRFCSVYSSLRRASFFCALYFVIPAASSKIIRRSSGLLERIWVMLPWAMML